jgi:hypothetical protein
LPHSQKRKLPRLILLFVPGWGLSEFVFWLSRDCWDASFGGVAVELDRLILDEGSGSIDPRHAPGLFPYLIGWDDGWQTRRSACSTPGLRVGIGMFFGLSFPHPLVLGGGLETRPGIRSIIKPLAPTIPGTESC